MVGNEKRTGVTKTLIPRKKVLKRVPAYFSFIEVHSCNH